MTPMEQKLHNAGFPLKLAPVWTLRAVMDYTLLYPTQQKCQCILAILAEVSETYSYVQELLDGLTIYVELFTLLKESCPTKE